MASNLANAALRRWRSELLERGPVKGLARMSILLILDCIAVATGFFVAIGIRFLDAERGDMAAAAALVKPNLPLLVCLFAGMNILWRLDRRLWRYAVASDLVALLAATAISTGIAAVADAVVGLGFGSRIPMSVILLGGFFTFLGMAFVRFRAGVFHAVWATRIPKERTVVRTLIFGAGDSGRLLANRLRQPSSSEQYRVVGFVDDDPAMQGLRVGGVKVLGGRADLGSLVERDAIDLVIIAISALSGERLRDNVAIALTYACP